jgi:hypothetical protein
MAITTIKNAAGSDVRNPILVKSIFRPVRDPGCRISRATATATGMNSAAEPTKMTLAITIAQKDHCSGRTETPTSHAITANAVGITSPSVSTLRKGSREDTEE